MILPARENHSCDARSNGYLFLLLCFRLFDGDKQAFAYDLGSLGRHYARYAPHWMKHWHATLPEGAILDVRYEDMVGDTEAEVRRLFDYLELPWDDRCLDFHHNTRRVTTASAAQVRKPIYQTSMARWKHFKGRHLAPPAELLDIHIDSPHVPATLIAPLKVAFISPFNLHDSSSGAITVDPHDARAIGRARRELPCSLTACCFDLACQAKRLPNNWWQRERTYPWRHDQRNQYAGLARAFARRGLQSQSSLVARTVSN